MKLQFIKAGEIVTTHGVRGEVKVLCWLDDPEMLCDFDRCRIGGKEYKMEQVRVQKTCNLVKLCGIDTMEAAQLMRGKITDVLDYPGNSVYVVKGEHEYMIPAVSAFIIGTDMAANRMDVQLIEGMRSDEN